MPPVNPIADHILVKPIEQENLVRGIARAQGSEERPSEGIVLAVGPGRVTEFGTRIPPEVSVGDQISFAPYAGHPIIDPRGFEPGTYLLVRQDEIYLNYGPSAALAKDKGNDE